MYQDLNVSIPFSKRDNFNNKVLTLIRSGNLRGVSQEEIFNIYTGKGGLHGLNRSDYDSYHQFSEAKKEIEQGQFFTPRAVCKELVNVLNPSNDDTIAELCCGSGNFINYLPNLENVSACELDQEAALVAQFLYPESNIVCQDIRYYNPDKSFDLIIGNPPFNLKWTVKGETVLSQLYYCQKAANLLKPSGLLAFIVPSTFLADEFSNKSMISAINEDFNFVSQLELKANTFKDFGVDKFNTKIIILQKKSAHLPEVVFNPSCKVSSFEELKNEIDIVKEQKKKVYAAIIQELNQEGNINDWSFKNRLDNGSVEMLISSEKVKTVNRAGKDGFSFKVKKLLFEIKTHPVLNKELQKAVTYVERFQTQEKPDGMEWEEWLKKRITENKVLAYLTRIVKIQNKPVKKDEIRLVKTNYGVKLKAYSPKMKRKLPAEYYWSFIDLVLFQDKILPFKLATHKGENIQKVIERKRKDFDIEDQAYPSMKENQKISNFLDTVLFKKPKSDKDYSLLDTQKNDINLKLQKRYGFLNWQQGTGKTPCTYAWALYRLQKNLVRNVFIVAPALAVGTTWTEFLEVNNLSFVEVRNFSDLDKIKKGDFVLVSLSMIDKLQRKLKGFVKSINQNGALVFDESDEITNDNAIATKAVKNVFRKLKYKINATGTATRNFVNELYPQMELLYNNSVNMICKCPKIYRQNRKSQELEEFANDNYMLPFSARNGANLFKSCFNPAKTTVFGIKKHNQDIFNIDSLRYLIEKMIITRKFKDIAGDDKYELHSHRVVQNDNEREVYRVIIEEFYQILAKYFTSTGNAKKDSGLRIIRQLRSLIKATSMPQSYSEYGSSSILPTKTSKILKMVDELAMEKVCIGCTTKQASKFYLSQVSSKYFRPVFYIDGEISFAKRRKILREFESSVNGVLVCTQQSLKSSVNIPSCNEVLLESLQWNFPKMEQFYFRFIRLDMLEKTNVHIITYDDTIEQNILALLLRKEQINDFIKTLEYKEQGDIFDEYGVDMDILNSIIEKEYDDEGKVKINWGKQNVA